MKTGATSEALRGPHRTEEMGPPTEDEILLIVISYNRPDRLPTINRLATMNYTGPVALLIADDDPQRDLYHELHGDKVVEFNKAATAAIPEFDNGDNFGSYNTAVYPRNACHPIASELGYRWYLILDDDYSWMEWRYDPHDRTYNYRRLFKLEGVIEALRDFQEATGIYIAISQGGEWLGGSNSGFGQAITVKRKMMNWFMYDTTQEPYYQPGNINEDVNKYTEDQRRGDVTCMTTNMVSLSQWNSQKNEGGMQDAYLDYGTYVKSFYTVMRCPSAVIVKPLGSNTKPRLHHSVDWDAVAPKIVGEHHKK